MLYHESSIRGVQCVRKYRFEAAHNEYNDRFTDRLNHIIYGDNIRTHGHNYELHILLQGDKDPNTGMVVELSSIDKIIEKYIIDRFDHRYLKNDIGSHTHEYFANKCSEILYGRIYHYYGLIIVEDKDMSYTKVIHEELPMILRTHIIDFSAAHQLSNPNFSDEGNNKVFGKCQRLHGHNYKLSVTISGTPNSQTGLLINSDDFDNIIYKIINKYDYKELHELEEFKNIIPTTENFVKVLWNNLLTLINIWKETPGSFNYYSEDLKLDTITLQETERNIFVYKGE